MYPLPPAPRCAPYLVFENDRLVGRAPDLVSLHALLCARQEHWGKTPPIERPGLDDGPRALDLWALFPALPHRKVIDARGVERGEFCSPGRMLAFFGCPPGRLHRMVDPGWDGDHRPRGRPIPGTGRRRSYSQAYLRRPRTQAERRQAFWLAEEGEPPVRPCRRIRALPTSWDDRPRKNWRDRSWKNFRATQWKG